MEADCGNSTDDLPGEESCMCDVTRDSRIDQLLHVNELPDSIFLHIFSSLSFTALGHVAQVCHRWRQIAKDDLLWKSIFLAHYKLPALTTLSPGAKSWKSEFRRLYDYTPCVLSEERKEHRDEVLHVSFSHDGTMFATCSKDGFFKVWRSSHQSHLLFEKNMMLLFSWKYTQFSQFNETDTCVLVSGVYFGGLSRSGEIAVFDVQGDFKMQCRVNNKPYDVFGAWYDNDHLLSGTLYVTGDFASVSAIWLSKASQEVESEMESVSMVLYRFSNVNASAIRLLNVAEVEMEQCEEEAKKLSAAPTCIQSANSMNVHADCAKRFPRRTCPCNTVPSEMSKLFQKQIAEDEFDITDEDESEDDDIVVDESSNGDKTNKICKWAKKGLYTDQAGGRLPNLLSDLSPSCSRSHLNTLLFSCDLVPDSDKKPAVDDDSSVTNSIVPLPSVEDGKLTAFHSGASTRTEDCHENSVYSSIGEDREEMASIRSQEMASIRSQDYNGSSDLLNITHNLQSNQSATVGVISREIYKEPDSDDALASFAKESEVFEIPAGNVNCFSSEKSSESKDDNQECSHGIDSLDYLGGDFSNNCDSGLTTKEVAGCDGEEEKESLCEPLRQMDTATQTEGTLSQASSFQSLSHMSHSSSLSNELCKSPREKLLIYTWGTETYIPHKIGIKRMKPSDFCKGARQAPILLPDVMENLQNMSGSRRDIPDVSIDMHGYIVGLCLSPDQRYLYVNCRSWPKGCIITDPLESLPLAQEVEISTLDLTTFQLTGPVLRSHKAYTDSEKCFFLNLDVSDHYVVSGAEDCRGYLWDRHYGIPLYHFDHRDVVSGVALNPSNSEMAVSVSDDHTFKVWISRRKARKYEKKGISFGHLTHRQSPV